MTRLATMACIAALCIAGAVSASAQTFTTLFSFDNVNGNGPSGGGSLIQGLNGYLIGQTGLGGAFNDGTLFDMPLNGSLLSSYSFGGDCNPNCPGAQPEGSLLQAPNGIVYGVTNAGGVYANGTVFKFTAKGGPYPL